VRGSLNFCFQHFSPWLRLWRWHISQVALGVKSLDGPKLLVTSKLFMTIWERMSWLVVPAWRTLVLTRPLSGEDPAGNKINFKDSWLDLRLEMIKLLQKRVHHRLGQLRRRPWNPLLQQLQFDQNSRESDFDSGLEHLRSPAWFLFHWQFGHDPIRPEIPTHDWSARTGEQMDKKHWKGKWARHC